MSCQQFYRCLQSWSLGTVFWGVQGIFWLQYHELPLGKIGSEAECSNCNQVLKDKWFMEKAHGQLISYKISISLGFYHCPAPLWDSQQAMSLFITMAELNVRFWPRFFCPTCTKVNFGTIFNEQHMSENYEEKIKFGHYLVSAKSVGP